MYSQICKKERKFSRRKKLKKPTKRCKYVSYRCSYFACGEEIDLQDLRAWF